MGLIKPLNMMANKITKMLATEYRQLFQYCPIFCLLCYSPQNNEAIKKRWLTECNNKVEIT